jgi:hypothetical protein
LNTPPAGPWWAAPVAAIVGIIVGFALKAWFDVLMERRKERREDRLRFIEEKMRGYADLGMACQETLHVIEQLQVWDRRREDLDARVQELIAAHGDAGPPEGLLEELRADVAAAKAHREELESQGEKLVVEMRRLASLLSLIAPVPIQDLMSGLVDALVAEEFDQAAYDRAHVMFVEAAGRDLGREPSSS